MVFYEFERAGEILYVFWRKDQGESVASESIQLPEALRGGAWTQLTLDVPVESLSVPIELASTRCDGGPHGQGCPTHPMWDLRQPFERVVESTEVQVSGMPSLLVTRR